MMRLIFFIVSLLSVGECWAVVASYPDQGAAYQACMAVKKATGQPDSVFNQNAKCDFVFPNFQDRYDGRAAYRCYGNYPYNVCSREWFDFPSNEYCPSRPPSGKGTVSDPGPDAPLASCDNGCRVVHPGELGSSDSYQAESYSLGGIKIYIVDGWLPSGGVCSSGDGVGSFSVENNCVAVDGLTQCVKPDGRHCAVASSGKEFCWDAGENGIKASGNDAATKAPQGKEVKPPPLPPNNGGEWEQVAQSTVVESKDGVTSSSSVTGWQSSYGSQGQGASGRGASGEGKGGSGSGSGLGGGGGGSGDGDGDGDGDGAGGVGPGAGDFYTPTGKTVESVFDAFKLRVSDSPLMDAVRDFFTVNGGGACPTFTVPASDYWGTMTYDAHCSGDFLAALQAIGWVLMAVAALAAAYWALS